MAAVLAGGNRAVLSHCSAAQLWEIQSYARSRLEITTPQSTRSRGQIQRHRAELRSDEVTVRWRIPVTTASRTILDLASIVQIGALEQALREAEVLSLPLRPSLVELLRRYPRRRGAAALKICLRRLERLPTQRTRSKLEKRFLSFLDTHSLPRPETNALLQLDDKIVEADCLWTEQLLIVELDGHDAHGTRSAFESDRWRDRALQAAGWRVTRITWRQLDDEADAVARDLRNLLVKFQLPATWPETNVRDNVQHHERSDERPDARSSG
jgi:very-short-patch-repair endonuclease